MDKFLKIDLQLFSDSIYQGDNPILSEPTNADNAQVEPQQTEPQQTENDFDMKGYIDNIYSNIATKIDEIKPKEEPIQEVLKEPTPEEIEAAKEELMNRWYENPLEVMKEMEDRAMQRAMETVKPIQEHFEAEQKAMQMDNTLREFASRTPDLQEHSAEMAQYLNENPNVAELPNALDIAYKCVKADKFAMQQQQAPVSFEDMLKDPGNLEKLLQNEEIKKMVVSNHLNNINQNKPPITIGGGGTTNITPPSIPKNLKEATQAWKATWK